VADVLCFAGEIAFLILVVNDDAPATGWWVACLWSLAFSDMPPAYSVGINSVDPIQGTLISAEGTDEVSGIGEGGVSELDYIDGHGSSFQCKG
jgi:hypothetical protein